MGQPGRQAIRGRGLEPRTLDCAGHLRCQAAPGTEDVDGPKVFEIRRRRNGFTG